MSPLTPGGVAGTPGAAGSPKMLNFRSGGTPRSGSRLSDLAAPSPYSLSPVGSDAAARSPASPAAHRRKVARTPFKVLDAPALQNDFYLNLLDWSAQNVIAVGLGPCVYLWSAATSKVTKLCDLSAAGGHVCSVRWTQKGTYLAVGTDSGEVQIWDPTRAGLNPVRSLQGHESRVGSLAWSSHLLASGSRDRGINLRDVRVPDSLVGALKGHRSEVCGLQWALDDRELASGGNDNLVHVWSTHSRSPGEPPRGRPAAAPSCPPPRPGLAPAAWAGATGARRGPARRDPPAPPPRPAPQCTCSASTRPPSRRWRGAPTSTGSSPRAAAPRTAASASGTPPLARASDPSTRAPRSATSRGPAPSTSSSPRTGTVSTRSPSGATRP